MSSNARSLAAASRRSGPALLPLLALAVAASFIASLLTRLVLLGMAWGTLAASRHQVLEVLSTGARTDLAVAAWLALPLACWLLLTPSRWRDRPWHRKALRAAAWLGTAVLLFVALSEVMFFEEFDGRFNFVAVDYLIYPGEVTANIWQSYHTGWLLAGIAAGATTIVWLAVRALGRARTVREPGGRLTIAAAYVAFLGLTTLTAGRAAPAARDDRVLKELADNGYAAFRRALLGMDAPYVGLYATRPEVDMLSRLDRLVSGDLTGHSPARSPRGGERLVTPAGGARRLNVVLVLEESFGSKFVGALGRSTTGLTARFDSLAAEGTLFANAYSTGNRTIRALEATTAALPPLPGISIVRREQSRDLFTLPAVLHARGYATRFIYGGRARFDGMGRFMRENGVERVIEQADFPPDAFRTAWGVADESIFDRALAEFDSLHREGRPFYGLVLSVSNHRPYTYPAGRIPEDPAEHRRTHAVRYADWALGRFLREARRHAWFDSTLFVVMGDHGPRVYGAAEIPLASYQVPILLYAPGIVPGGARVNGLVSSLDVPPTVLGLLGLPYRSRFLGRDVLANAPAAGRALMTHNDKLAMLSDSTLVVLGLRSATTVYRRGPDGTWVARAASTVPDRELIEDAIAYFGGADLLYRTARYRFSTIPHPPPPGVSIVTTSPATSSRRHFAGSGSPFSRLRPVAADAPPIAPRGARRRRSVSRTSEQRSRTR